MGEVSSLKAAPHRGWCRCGNRIAGRARNARICLECAGRLADCPHCPSKVASEGLPACSAHLEAELGITYRQLDFWVRKGWLKPELPAPGSGVSRRWPAGEVEIIRRMRRLAGAGVTVERAAGFARWSWPAGQIAPGLWLEVRDAAEAASGPGRGQP